MSEHNITVEGGTSIRLLTAGKYCDRDIMVTASGGLRVVTQEWEVTEFKSYDEFPDFMSVYNLPVLDYECTVYNYTFENNTENLRAGKYVIGIGGKANGNSKKVEIDGVRVGGIAGGNRGVDVYPGCKIILTQKYL